MKRAELIKKIGEIVEDISSTLDEKRSRQYISQITNDKLDSQAKHELISRLAEIDISLEDAMYELEDALEDRPDNEELNELLSFLDYYYD